MMHYGGIDPLGARGMMPNQQSWMQGSEQPMGTAGMQTTGSMDGSGTGTRPLSRTTVYVGGLLDGADPMGPLIDEAALHNFFFSRCGSVNSIRAQPERGCCFVDFETEIAASTAVSLNGTFVALRPGVSALKTRIMVRYAYERPSGRSTIDRGGGYQQQQPQAGGTSFNTSNAVASNGAWMSHGQMMGSGGAAEAGWGGGGGDTGLSAWRQQQFQQQQMMMDPSYGAGGWSHAVQGGGSELMMGAWDGMYGGGTHGGWAMGPQQTIASMVQQRPRSPSPPRFPRYSDSENRAIKDLLKRNLQEIDFVDAAEVEAGKTLAPGGTLLRAIHTMTHWMTTGECDKKTSDNFFIYLKGLRSKLGELKTADVERSRLRHQEDIAHLNGLFAKCDAINKAFQEAGKQKVKDMFSKVQRKKVDEWASSTADVAENVRQLLRLKCDATEENMELEMPRPGDPSDDPSDDEGALKQGPASDRGIVAPPPPPFEGGADLNTERAEGLADHEADVMGGGSASMPEGSSAKRQRMDKDTKEEPASIVCEQHQSDVKQSREMLMLSSRIEQLERMLMEKLASSGPPAVFAEPSEVAEEVCRAKLASEGSDTAVDAAEKGEQAIVVQPRGTPATGTMNSTVANTVSVISIHLASYPNGAPFSQLCHYIASFCPPQPDGVDNISQVKGLVQDALNFAPGIFTLEEVSGDQIWKLSAFHTLREQLNSQNGLQTGSRSNV